MGSWSLPATPRILPPLDLSSENGSLVQGLRKLQHSSTRYAPCESARPSRVSGVSYLGQVANSRLQEADTELNMYESQVYASLKPPPVPERRSDRNSMVEHKSAASDQGQRIRPVKQDEVVLETLKMQEVRHYKVALPSRPVVVTVSVTRTSGVSPALWGSTQAKRPSNIDNEYKGKDDKLVYEHAVMPSTDQDGEDRAEANTRVTVPSFREFYFTLDASRAECTLKFVVSFGNIKVKVEDIFSPKVARARHGWEARLAAVTRTRQTREDFEERLHVMQTQRKQKIEEFASGRNFLEANQLSLAMENWPQRQLKIQRKAVFACHRQTVASWRRERLEEEQQERHVQWMSRAENKRREREEQELQHALQLQQESRHQTWLTDLMVGTFVKTVAEIFQERRREMDRIRRELASATVLDSTFRRNLVRKRRSMIWRNAIKMRLAMTIYARTVLPMVKCLAAPLIKDFITTNAFNKEAPSISTVFSQYRASVMRIQHFWLQLRIMRKAYLPVLMPVWKACEEQVYEVFEKDLSAARAAAAKAQDEKFAELAGLLDRKSPRHKGSEADRRGAKDPKKIRMRTMPALSRAQASSKDLHEAAEEHVPTYIAELALYEHITLMQHTFPARVKKWEESMREAQDNADVENFLKTAEAESSTVKQLRLSRPRKIYVDEEEIMSLVRRTVDTWHKGGFIDVKLNRRRILRFGFKVFVGEHRLRTQSQSLTDVRRKRKDNRRSKAAGFGRAEEAQSPPILEGVDEE